MLTLYYLHARNWLREQLERQEGQDLAEYAIMLGVIALAVIAVVIAIGGKVSNIFTAFDNAFTGGSTGS